MTQTVDLLVNFEMKLWKKIHSDEIRTHDFVSARPTGVLTNNTPEISFELH